MPTITGWILAGLVILPSLIWARGIFLWAKQALTRTVADDNLPSVSVIVAGRNEAAHIEDCLRSLLALDYPRDRLELCFVDDHSTDNTLEIAARFAESHPDQLKILSAPDDPPEMGSKKRALAHAVANGSGDILCFTDADNRVPKRLLRSLITHFDEQTGAVVGAAIPGMGSSLGDRLYRLERFTVNLTSASAIGFGQPGTACGQNLSLRRAALEQIGGHAHPNWPSGDDDLTVQALARAGWKVQFANDPNSVVTDARIPGITQHTHSAARHQSTLRFYPLRWRLLYGLSIASGVAMILLLVGAGLSLVSLSISLGAVCLRLCLDAVMSFRFTRKLKIPFSMGDFLLSELFLPLYLIARPLLILLPTYRWRGVGYRKNMKTASGPAVNP